ncbi:MAG TPA: Npt1/Npt2 family nucleotide transporter [Vicinamibacterales bacterium]|nr:Npt1/Npt2 family nucleotide transporter [Vicinamibacterales bacterium]
MRSISGLPRLLGIQAGEGAPVGWLIVHSLFNGIFSAFFLTAANALFLARFPITVLPLAYIGAAVVGYVAVMLFSRLERHVSIGVLLTVTLGVLLSLASAFWLLRRATDADWVVFSMFVAVGPMFNLIGLGYWGLAGRLFDLRQAKRLFGLVGAGEELSTIVALFSTPLLIRLIGDPTHLVLLAAAGLAGSFATAAFIAWRFKATLETHADAMQTTTRTKTAVGLGDLLRVRYFLLMAACVVLLNLALYTVDFSFLSQVRIQFQGPGQIAQFFGIFFGALKIVEFLMKVGVSGPLLSHFGLNVGLLVLPVLLSLSAGFAIIVGSFGLGSANFFVLVALSKLVAVVGRSSTFEPSFRVLYQPIAPSERIAYQSHVEGTARQFSIGAVGLALLFFSRGGSFRALNLFYLLVPILGLWFVAAVLVHREYRVRLFAGLKDRAGAIELRGLLDILMPYLRSDRVEQRRRALRVIERVEPGSLPVALTSAFGGASSAARVAALECVGSRRMVDLEPQVAEMRTARDRNPETDAAIQLASSQLTEVRALKADRARLDVLAGSSDPDERHLAAVAIGYGAPADAERLSVLLWDREARVRQAALAAAGRLGNPEFRTLLVRHLGIPLYASAAAAALVTIGPPAVPDLDRAFGQADQTPVVRRRILKILRDIGDPEAMAELASKLDSPERSVRRRAIELLVGAGYRATPVQVPLVERVAESVVRDMVWDMGVLVALADSPDAAPVRDALENELIEGRRWLFDLLSLVYDPGSVTAVREIVESGSPQAMVHALEILDLLISPVLKPFVFPLLEAPTPAAVVRKLEVLIPREHFTPYEALRALVSRGYGRIGLWTRAVALDRLGRAAEGVPADLVAFLFHPEAMIREVAAMRITARDRRAWETHRKRLRFDVREQLEAVVGVAEAEGEEAASIFGRTRLLRRVIALAVLPPEDLIVLAAASEIRTLQAGQRVPSPRDPQHAFFVTLEGEVVLRAQDAGMTIALPPFTVFTFEPGAPPVETVADTTLIRIEPTSVFELAAEEPELIPGLVRAAEALGRDAAA